MSERATRPPIRCYRQSALPHIIIAKLERGLTPEDYSFLRGIADVFGFRTLDQMRRWALERQEERGCEN